MKRLFATLALLVAGCGGNPMAGVCQGNTCGKSGCNQANQCTDFCEKMTISAGDHCPEGYGCLGFVTCVNHDLGNPFDLYGVDFSPADGKGGPVDQSMPGG